MSPRAEKSGPAEGARLFVYGTLRRGFKRHSTLVSLGASFVGRGVVAGGMYELGQYPGGRPDESGEIVGELYWLPDRRRALDVLDRIEGCTPRKKGRPSFFRRALTAVKLEHRERVKAWIYWYNRDLGAARRIASGDYTRK